MATPVERLNRTLMERLRGLPGTTGSSAKGRKERKSEKGAALTLAEYERWMVLEIAQRYHQSPHRGLQDATPAGVWKSLSDMTPPRQLLPDQAQALRFVVQFLPMEPRTIQREGLTFFHIRYWHPVFAAWRETRKKVIVRYHPEDLSRVFVSADYKTYVEARCADIRRPPHLALGATPCTQADEGPRPGQCLRSPDLQDHRAAAPDRCPCQSRDPGRAA